MKEGKKEEAETAKARVAEIKAKLADAKQADAKMFVRHVVCFCFCDNVTQLAVVCRIRSALFDSDYDLTADDGKDFTFFCVVLFFLMLNIGKF